MLPVISAVVSSRINMSVESVLNTDVVESVVLSSSEMVSRYFLKNLVS